MFYQLRSMHFLCVLSVVWFFCVQCSFGAFCLAPLQSLLFVGIYSVQLRLLCIHFCILSSQSIATIPILSLDVNCCLEKRNFHTKNAQNAPHTQKTLSTSKFKLCIYNILCSVVILLLLVIVDTISKHSLLFSHFARALSVVPSVSFPAHLV